MASVEALSPSPPGDPAEGRSVRFSKRMSRIMSNPEANLDMEQAVPGELVRKKSRMSLLLQRSASLNSITQDDEHIRWPPRPHCFLPDVTSERVERSHCAVRGTRAMKENRERFH